MFAKRVESREAVRTPTQLDRSLSRITAMMKFLCALTLAATLSVTTTAEAQYSQTIGEFNGVNDTEAPFPQYTMGTFSGFPSSAGITFATISGTFGNSVVSNSARSQIFLGSVLVASCVEGDCRTAGTPTPWSYTFSAAEYTMFDAASLDLTIQQTNTGTIRQGDATLTIRSNPVSVPEPTSAALIGLGLVALGGAARRRAKHS
jgi:hypothetical protein